MFYQKNMTRVNAAKRFCTTKSFFVIAAAILIGGFFMLAGRASAMAPFNTLNVESNPTKETYYNAVIKTADRLVALQSTGGSWDWVVTNATTPATVTYLNITGVTAEGLLSAYKITGKQIYLDAAKLAGDYIISGIDSSSPKKINAYNVLFLQKLSIALNDTSYATKAAAYFAMLYSDTPTTICSSGCLDSAGIIAGQKAVRGATTIPDGIVLWDLMPYVEYTSLIGDTTHATEIETAIMTEVTDTAYASTISNYDLGLAAALKAAKLTNDSANITTISEKLVADTDESFGKTAEGKIQVTSYTLRALKLASDSRADAAVTYIMGMSGRILTGGWVDTDGNEYAEINSEAITALADFLPSNTFYTIQDAVNNSREGDVIKINPGDYNLTKDDVTIVSGQTGWYLPISKNNITLMGVDTNGQEITNASSVMANIYSTQETANGSWASQNLITVFGDNVTFKGLGIMNKISPNKGIEVVGDNFMAENCLFTPISADLFSTVADYHDITDNSDHNDISKYGSGVYFNNNGTITAKSGTITNNIFKNSGITFDSFGNNWTVNINNNTFDGNKVWSWTDINGLQSQYYSSVGATTWANQPNFTDSIININNNKFINMASDQPLLKIKDTMTGAFNAINNWWGDASGPATSTIIGDITYSPFYIDEAKTMTNIEAAAVTDAFDGISATLAGNGIANSLGDVTGLNYKNAPELYFEKSIDGVKMGKITFASGLDLSNTETQTFLQNLGTKMDMAGAGVIGLDFTGETAATTLKGISATIKFYGLDKLGFDASSTAAEINSRLVAVDENGNALDRSSLISDSNMGTYTVPVGACEVGGACYTFEIPVNHFTKYKVLEKTQVAPETNEDGYGTATINSETPEVVIASSTQPLIIDVADGTENAMINYDALITDGSGLLPETTINTQLADIVIPAGTTVTSASTTWNGIMAAPTITTVTLPETPGQTKTLSSAIEIGFSGARLSFDKGVRILMPGQADKRVGYTRSGESFTEITNICAADDQTTGDTLPANGDCKINSGDDLVVWTKHFTAFATYTQTTNSSGGGGGSYVTTSCSNITYGEWGSVFNGLQYRAVLTQTPSNCALTSSQIAAESRIYTPAVEETLKPEETTPTQQVLGVQKYAIGTLLRSKLTHRIYVVVGENTLKRILNLKELYQYRGKPILSVDESVIASYSIVLGTQKYADGTLVRSRGDHKIYVIINGLKVHIRNLQELRRYAGRAILTIE